MAKLSDMQRIILSTASTRGSGLVRTLKDIIAEKEAGAVKAVAALEKRGLIEQGVAGSVITDTGRAAIDGGEGQGLVIRGTSRPEPEGPRTIKAGLVLGVCSTATVAQP